MSHVYTDTPMQFLLWLRLSKLNKAGTAPVYLRIFLDNFTRVEYATGIRCAPEQWGGGERKILSHGKAARLDNTTLDTLKSRARLLASDLQTAANGSGSIVLPADVAAALRPRQAAPAALLVPALLAAVPAYSAKVTTREVAKHALGWLAGWPGAGRLPVAGFTAAKAAEWVAWLKGQGLAPATLSCYIGVVAGLLRRAAPEHPPVLARQRKGLAGAPVRPRRALPVDWQQRLAAEAAQLTAAEALACDVLLLQYYLHGSRIGAVLELSWQHVDEAAGRVRLPTHKRALVLDVALHPGLVALLGRYHQRGRGGLVLPLLPADYARLDEVARHRALRRATVSVNQALRRVGERLGLGRLHSHLARHTLALRAYEANGYDIRLVQQLLGHSNPGITAAYLQPMRPDELDAGAAAVYGPPGPA